MGFEDLLAMLVTGGDDLPDTIHDDLGNAYRNDIEMRDAKITGNDSVLAEKDSVIAALTDELTKQKALNFDLLMATPAGEVEPETESESDEPDGSDGIESLYEKETD